MQGQSLIKAVKKPTCCNFKPPLRVNSACSFCSNQCPEILKDTCLKTSLPILQVRHLLYFVISLNSAIHQLLVSCTTNHTPSSHIVTGINVYERLAVLRCMCSYAIMCIMDTQCPTKNVSSSGHLQSEICWQRVHQWPRRCTQNLWIITTEISRHYGEALYAIDCNRPEYDNMTNNNSLPPLPTSI